MSTPPSTRRTRAVALVALVALLLGSLWAGAAGADTPTPPSSGPFTLSVTTGGNTYTYPANNAGGSVTGPTIPNVTDGQLATVDVSIPGGGAIAVVDVRQCKGGVSVNNLGDFDPFQTNLCSTVVLGAGSGNAVAGAYATSGPLAPGTASTSVPFNLGTGSAPTIADPFGGPDLPGFSCDAANPCQLVVFTSVASGGGSLNYQSFPINFASTAPPGAPGTPVATAGSNGAANLSWTAAPGAASYTVASTPTGASCTVASGGSGTSASCTGLAVFTPYSFVVTAVNPFGTAASAASNSVTSSPTAPTITGANAGNESILVNWSPAGVEPTGYQIVALPGSSTQNVTPPATSGTVSGLTNGTAYTVTVVALYPGGNSVSSAAVGPVTPTGQFVTQTFTVTRPVGALLIGEDCSGVTGGQNSAAGNPVMGVPNQNCNIDLGTASINPSGTYYTANGNIQNVTVLDTRDDDLGWTVTASLTPFTTPGPPADAFDPCNFGLAPSVTEIGAPTGYTQASTAGPAVAPNCAPPTGGYGTPRIVAEAAPLGGLGFTIVSGSVNLQIPVTADAGQYTAVLTFTLLTK